MHLHLPFGGSWSVLACCFLFRTTEVGSLGPSRLILVDRSMVEWRRRWICHNQLQAELERVQPADLFRPCVTCAVKHHLKTSIFGQSALPRTARTVDLLLAAATAGTSGTTGPEHVPPLLLSAHRHLEIVPDSLEPAAGWSAQVD